MNELTAPVFDGIQLEGRINVTDEVVLQNVRSSIRRQLPQVWAVAPNYHRAVIVGGGPSLESTLPELRKLVAEGAKLVTVNGSLQWCLDRGLLPRAQVVLDARPENARFVAPDVPLCRYYLCSQCAPQTFDAVAGRAHVAIWHDASGDDVKAELDEYYLGQWAGIAGGTTVGTRAIGLLRTLGFLRFDLFGFDSCWFDDAHHAYAQPENDRDKRFRLTIEATESDVPARDFWVSPWHVKQLEDLILFMRTSGQKFLLNVHGDGLLAYALRAHANVNYTTGE